MKSLEILELLQADPIKEKQRWLVKFSCCGSTYPISGKRLRQIALMEKRGGTGICKSCSAINARRTQLAKREKPKEKVPEELELLTIEVFAERQRDMKLLVKYPCCGATRILKGHRIMQLLLKQRNGEKVSCVDCAHKLGRVKWKESIKGKTHRFYKPRINYDSAVPTQETKAAQDARNCHEFMKLMASLNRK